MKLNEITENEKPILLVFGKLCSGKGTFCKRFTSRHHIVTSDVVRKVSKMSKRSDLQKTKNLDTQIADELISQIEEYDKVVVDGIRQTSIIEILVNHFGEDNIDFIWLEVPQEEMKRRYFDRGDDKDAAEHFEQALQLDSDLGLDDVENWLKGRQNTDIVDNY